MLAASLMLLLQDPFVPPEPGPLCGVIETRIEPDMHWYESQITADAYRRAERTLTITVPEWIEERFSRNRTTGEAFSGEVWLAWKNALAISHAYVLKLEALNAPETEREAAIAEFCSFLAETPVYD